MKSCKHCINLRLVVGISATLLAAVCGAQEKTVPQNKAITSEKTQLVIKEIRPFEATAELRGRLVLFTNDKGELQIKGTMEVLREGWIATRKIVHGVEVEFMPGGRIKLPVKKSQQLDWTYGLWLPGVKHEIKGTIKELGQDGYVFSSNTKEPLVFRLVKDVGYVYVKGKGTVKTPEGKERKLP